MDPFYALRLARTLEMSASESATATGAGAGADSVLSDGVPTLPLFISGVQDPGAHTLLLVHGWPDDEREFVCQVEHFRSRYHIATVRLPWFGTYATAEADAVKYGHSRRGYAFSQMGEALARAAKSLGNAPITCICHDWGSIVTQMAELAHPGLFHSCVVIDVGLPKFMVTGDVWRLKTALHIALAGFFYQWRCAFSYYASSIMPGFARWYMNALVRKVIPIAYFERRGVQQLLKSSSIVQEALQDYPARGDTHPLCGFMYFEIQRMYWLRIFRLVSPCVDPKMRPKIWSDFPSCPVLFIYGKSGKGGVPFHERGWEKALEQRTDGSKVVPFEDAGHWLHLEKPEETNQLVEEWLDSLPKTKAKDAVHRM